MNEELLRQLNQNFAELNNILGSAGGINDSFRERMIRSDEEVDLLDRSNRVRRTGLEIEEDVNQQRKAEIEARRAEKAALDNSKRAILDFIGALTDANTDLTKYTKGVNGALDAVGELAGKMGPLGKAVQAVTTGLSFFTEKVLKQTENMVKAYDQMAKVGGAAGLTAEQITDFGKNAGFSTHVLATFTKQASEASGLLVTMGGSVSEGLKAFSDFTAVGDAQLKIYRRLGLTQEQLIEAQTAYAKQQIATGNAMSRSPKELQAASLAYIDNLMALSELTGISIEEQQKGLDAAMANEQFNAYVFAQNKKAAELEAAGRKPEADAIRKEVEMRQQLASVIQATGSAEEKTAGLSALSTEGIEMAYSKATSRFLMQERDFNAILRDMREGKSGVDRYISQTSAGAERAAETLGPLAYAYGPEAAKSAQAAFGYDVEQRNFAMRMQQALKEGKTVEQALQDIQAKKEGKGPEDTVMAGKAAQESLERTARNIEDTLTEGLNPFREGSIKAGLAAVGLAAAAALASSSLSSLAGRNIGGAVAGNLPGTGGTAPGGGGGLGGKAGMAGKLARGFGLGAVGLGAGMAADALGRDTPSGKGATVLEGAATGAGIGALLGPAGMAIGGIIGTGYGLYKAFQARGESQQQGGAGGDVNDDEVKKMIEMHEGKRNRPYQDSLGKWTVGIGHLIGDGSTLPPDMDRTFTEEEIQSLFDKDYRHHKAAAEKIEGYDKFNPIGKAALIDLTFNMGPSWVTAKGFKRFEKAAKEGDAALAAQSLRESKWYEQVGNRGPTIVGMIGNGISAADGGIASGPVSGYAATLHGNEMIQPLDPNSILERLATTPANADTAELMAATAGATPASENMANMMSLQASMIEMLSGKLDNVINRLEVSNNIQDKIFKYSAS